MPPFSFGFGFGAELTSEAGRRPGEFFDAPAAIGVTEGGTIAFPKYIFRVSVYALQTHEEPEGYSA